MLEIAGLSTNKSGGRLTGLKSVFTCPTHVSWKIYSLWRVPVSEFYNWYFYGAETVSCYDNVHIIEDMSVRCSCYKMHIWTKILLKWYDFCFRRFAVQSNCEVSVLKCIYSFIYIGIRFHELYQTSNYIALNPKRRSSPPSSTTSFPWARPLMNGLFAVQTCSSCSIGLYICYDSCSFSPLPFLGEFWVVIHRVWSVKSFIYLGSSLESLCSSSIVRSCYRFVLPFKFVYEVKFWHPLFKSLCLY